MPNLGPNFYPKLVQIASEVGMKPEDLIAVMVSESGMNPGAVEKTFKGSGLVGFMPSTLKGLGFKGTWEDFSKLSGEDQLDWLKKLVQGYKSSNGGKAFTSAAQYYTANLWPIALRLPGVKAGDPNTPFIEAHPAVVKDPKTGEEWSKKYFDVGIKISPKQEMEAYKYNPLFDKDKKGAITYGDMLRQVEINKKNPIYQKAISAMHAATGYTPKQELPSSEIAVKTPEFLENLNKMLNTYLSALASDYRVQKKYLSKNDFLIKINSNELYNSIEYSRILCEALEEELSSRTYVHSNGTDVEIECKIYGNPLFCKKAVKSLCDGISRAFNYATKGIEVEATVLSNTKSQLEYLDDKLADSSYRKFRLNLLSKQG